MGDIQSLIEKAAAEVDEEQAKELSQKLRKAEFDYNDFLTQMQQILKDGRYGKYSFHDARCWKASFPALIWMKASAPAPCGIHYPLHDKEERANPGLINPSRKQRIAKGAGVDVSEVNRLVKQFDQMKKMMKQDAGPYGRRKAKGLRRSWWPYGRELKPPF